MTELDALNQTLNLLRSQKSEHNKPENGKSDTLNTDPAKSGGTHNRKKGMKKRKLPPTAFMRDGKRRIDFILAFNRYEYSPDDKRYTFEEDYVWARSAFERALKRRGLELESEDTADKKTTYVKVHAPFDALAIQAELEQLNMPTMRSDIDPPKLSRLAKWVNSFNKNPFELQPEFIFGKPTPEYFTDSFTRTRQDEFLIEDKDTFFTEAHRVFLVWGILSSTRIVFNWVDESNIDKGFRKLKKSFCWKRFQSLTSKKDTKTKANKNVDELDDEEEYDEVDEVDVDDEEEEVDVDDEVESSSSIITEDNKAVKFVDVQYLIRQKVYSAAFPLHDADIVNATDTDNPERWPLRKYLYESWARPKQWHKYQPLDAIRRYFGEKVGLYFAWLGFYTKMLILPSIVGLLFFFGGLIAFQVDEVFDIHEDIRDFCNTNRTISQRTLCRNCRSTTCSYSTLHDLCNYAKLTRCFDNSGASAFAIFMAIWAVFFLELWKRRQMELSVRWDVTEQRAEGQIRPDFILKAPTTRMNPVTKMVEPYLPRTSKAQRLTASIATVIFFLAVVTALIATVMAYKILGPIFWRERLKFLDQNGFMKTRFDPTLLTSITASLLNGVFIGFMSKIYSKVAWKLTLWEYPRTDKDFEESYTYKVFIFQSVNYYGTLAYLAFIRGQLIPPPHIQSNFQQRCNATGCMLDVSIQLGIIMTGKQAVNNFAELGIPLIMNWYRRFQKRHKSNPDKNIFSKLCPKIFPCWFTCEEEQEKSVISIVPVKPRWESDHSLNAPAALPLFGDYLEMLIQYGFVTMFVPAFPLTPLFALLNNIIEIRLDAFKAVTQVRRPVPVRVKTIAPWDNLLGILTKVAVLSNAAIIAITTDFIDRQVYYNWYRDSDMSPHAESYMDFVLTKFDTSILCRQDARNAKEEDAGNKILDALGGSSSLDSCSNIRGNVSECYFRDYRDPLRDYARSAVWWHVIVAKFAFVLVFEHVVFVLQAFLRYWISGVPEDVKIRIERSRFLQRQSFLRQNFGDVEYENSSVTDDDTKSKAYSDVTSYVLSVADETDETMDTVFTVLNEILDEIEEDEYLRRLGVNKDEISTLPGSLYVEMAVEPPDDRTSEADKLSTKSGDQIGVKKKVRQRDRDDKAHGESVIT